MATAVLPDLKRSARPLASWRHTALLVAFFVTLSALGIVLQHRAGTRPDLSATRPNLVRLYLSLIAAEWGLVYWVWKGIRRNGTGLLEMIGGKWTSARSVAADSLAAFATWLILQGIELGWSWWLGSPHAASVSSLQPRRLIEALLWIVLSLSAGFSEELVFRGYLQRQFTALFGGPLALVLQSAVFGIAHAYQGFQAAALISIWGAAVTGLTLWRKNLRSAMLVHAWTDIASGLIK